MKPEPESFADVYNDTKDDQTIRSFLTNARIWISGWHLKKDEDDMAWCSASPIQGRSITHVKLCSAASAFDVADDKAGGHYAKAMDSSGMFHPVGDLVIKHSRFLCQHI